MHEIQKCGQEPMHQAQLLLQAITFRNGLWNECFRDASWAAFSLLLFHCFFKIWLQKMDTMACEMS